MDFNKLCLKCMRESVIDGQCKNCQSTAGFDQMPAFALPLNTILHGRYLIGAVLGHGGFGITYMAYDLKNNERVAIKEFMPDGLSTRVPGTTEMTIHTSRDDYEYGLKKFLEEARMIHVYRDNPHIISVRALFEENRTAYYVMEYLDGCDLKKYIQKKGGRLPWSEAINLLLPIFDALDQIHSQNVIHRDISPDNIYVCGNGKVKLLDFGAARVALKGKSQSLSIILKRGYAPEEQYRSHGKQGPFTDVYALAGTLYFTITGTIPPEATQRMFKDELTPPSVLCRELPQHMDRAIMKALSVKAQDRFQSMGAFKAALTGVSSASSGTSWPEEKPSASLNDDRQMEEKPRAAASTTAPADIGRRFAALIIDGLILAAIFYGLLLNLLELDTIGGLFWVLYLLSVAYGTGCESSKLQATFGKRIMGLAVIDNASQPLTFKKALLRNAVKFSNTLFSALGSMELGGLIGIGNGGVCLINKERSAGHDLIAKTCVTAAARSQQLGQQGLSQIHHTPEQPQCNVVIPSAKPSALGIEGLSGYYENVFFPLSEKRVVLGRSAEKCQIIFPDDSRGVSRVHCELLLDKEARTVYIKDLGSSNGTFVSGIGKLPGEKGAVLNEGDCFTIGENHSFRIKATRGG